MKAGTLTDRILTRLRTAAGRPEIAYLGMAAGVTGCILAGAFAFNLLVDPLWYAGGNRLTGINYGFDERLSKTTRFLRHADAYDCVLFGSSRSAAIDTRQIDGGRCYNFSFSAATLCDYAAYARYLRERVGPLRRVIVGLDSFNLVARPLEETVPPFVLKHRPPTPVALSYLSLDATFMSLRLIGKGPPEPRYYDHAFVGRINTMGRVYDPSVDLKNPASELKSIQSMARSYGPFDTRNLVYLNAIRDAFPEARLTGYAPPTSAFQFVRMQRNGNLPGYVAAMHAAAAEFDTFIDFTVPSAVTADTQLTYDGAHFLEPVMAQVAQALDGRPPADFGVDVKALSLEAYGAAFDRALAHLSTAEFEHAAAQPGS